MEVNQLLTRFRGFGCAFHFAQHPKGVGRKRQEPGGKTVLAYPIFLEEDEGALTVTSPDFPELATFGVDREDATARAADALEEVIDARIDEYEDIPPPSMGSQTTALPPLLEAKVMVYREMRRQGMGKSEMARRLGLASPHAERALYVQTESRLDPIAALERIVGH